MTDAPGVWAVIRLKGHNDRKIVHESTLRMLRLTRSNHLTLVPKDDSHRGMVKKVEHLVTYGEPTADTIEELLRKRALKEGNHAVTEAELQKATGKGFRELAAALATGEVRLNELEALKPVFRLHPPVKGLRSTKHHYSEHGDLGYRGDAINDLIRRMI